VPLDIRPMLQFDLEYNEIEDFINCEGNWIKQPSLEEAIIKVKITCDKEEYSKVDEMAIRKHLYCAKQVNIEYDIIKKARIRSKRIKESSSPVKAFEHYAKLNKFDKATVELGLKILGSTK
jgi:hypothetical protein